MSKENDMEEAIKKLIVLRKKVNNIRQQRFSIKEKPLLSFTEQFKSHYSSQAMRFENININRIYCESVQTF